MWYNNIMSSPKKVAIILAAGTGTRMKQDIPKQFMHIENKPLIIYTLEAFQKHPSINSIIVVCLDGWHDILKAYAKQFNITKLTSIVSGGQSGQESIRNGILEAKRLFNEKNTIAIIHDGNRGLVSNEIISDAISTFNKHGNAVAAIPCTEAIYRSSDGITGDAEIPREQLYRTQTPHVWPLKKVLWAHEEAEKLNITNTTATCSLMQQLGEKVYFSKGSEKNLKITTIEDIDLFKAILHSERETWVK